MRALPTVTLIATLAAAGCSNDHHVVRSGPRDWAAHPAVVTLDVDAPVYAVSDVHGGYDRLVALLAAHGLAAAADPSPRALLWTGGAAPPAVPGGLTGKGGHRPGGVGGRRALQA